MWTAAEYRDMTAVELRGKESEAREQLFRLRFQISMGQTDGIKKKYRATKKDLARILTAMNQKNRAEGN